MTTWSRWLVAAGYLHVEVQGSSQGTIAFNVRVPGMRQSLIGSERMQVLNRAFSRGAWCGVTCEKKYHVWKSEILWWKFEPATWKLKVAKIRSPWCFVFFSPDSVDGQFLVIYKCQKCHPFLYSLNICCIHKTNDFWPSACHSMIWSLCSYGYVCVGSIHLPVKPDKGYRCFPTVLVIEAPASAMIVETYSAATFPPNQPSLNGAGAVPSRFEWNGIGKIRMFVKTEWFETVLGMFQTFANTWDCFKIKQIDI